jgi:hypothetical protein
VLYIDIATKVGIIVIIVIVFLQTVVPAWYADIFIASPHISFRSPGFNVSLVTFAQTWIYMKISRSPCCFEIARIAGTWIAESLLRRQSQQSFNTLTPFNFLFYSLPISAPTGHPQVRYTISYFFYFLKD